MKSALMKLIALLIFNLFLEESRGITPGSLY